MSVHTDNSTVSEHDSHSDSDWLDIASTDRDSDDNDSIYSSRETDHEDLSRSRSRRSSLSYGSSPDGDVDAWEGLIEDNADDGMPNDVPAPNHVVSLTQHPAALDLSHIQDTSPEELRVKEGLDQSMISTLSSSRSSSLHASTAHNSTRDLRLSFPDPITSSCREPLATLRSETQPISDPSYSFLDPDTPSDASDVDDEVSPVSQQTLSQKSQPISSPAPSGPELKVFLFGSPTVFKWFVVNKLIQKVAHGAGVTTSADLESLQGPVRKLTVSGPFGNDRAFPRIITVFDRTLRPHDTADDLALMDFPGVRPLAIIFLPCRPLRLPEYVLHLPITLPLCSNELPDFANVEIGSQRTWDTLNIPSQQILRITPEGPSIIDKDSIDMIDSSRAYRAFSRLWSGDNISRGIMASTHTLTIIAILSLILGLVVRAALPVSLHQFASPTLVNLTPNCTSSCFWQMFRQAPYRERLPPSTTLDNSVVVIPSSYKDSSLSIFTAESTSVALSHANPTSFRRVTPPTLSERPKFSKDLMLQPPCSVLSMANQPKALSVISPSTTYHSIPEATGRTVSILTHTAVPAIVKECASVVLSIVNQEMQDILDALDALVLAISKQTQIIRAQATTFIEQSSVYLEKGKESVETVKGTLRAHNERARRRAKEIKEKGAKWLVDASEAVTIGARFSQEVAWELAEGLTYRAQRARGKAKEIAAEFQDFLNEYDGLDVLGIDAWDSHMQRWDELVKRTGKQGNKLCKRKHKSSIFC